MLLTICNTENRLKQPIVDEWSIREKLALASTVLKSGDQNYNSVTRPLKAFGEPNRPADWFSQKNCALQYDELLEKAAPKRKRGERGEETAQHVIVRDLTNKRLEELRQLIAAETEKLENSRHEYEIVTGDNPPEELLKEIWQRKLDQEKQKIVDAANYENYLKDRETKIAAAKRATRAGLLRTPVRISSSSSIPVTTQIVVKTELDSLTNESGVPIAGIVSPSSAVNQTSPLLTSLLQSPSSTQTFQPQTRPTEAGSLSPNKTFFSNASSRTPMSSRPTSPAVDPSIPSTSPTLSKLLEKPITLKSASATSSPRRSSEISGQKDTEGPAQHETVVIKAEKETDNEERSEGASETDSKTPQTRRQLRGRSSVVTPSVPTPSVPKTRRSGRIKGLRESESDAPATPLTTDKKVSISDFDVFASEESTDASLVKIQGSSKAPSMIDSVPNSPASSTMHSEDTDAVREQKRWHRAITSKVLKEAQIHRYSKNFILPVTDKEVKGYSETVKRPMDLTTIKKRLDNPSGPNGIRTTAEFQRELMLMFQNALMYNKPDHEVYQEALAMQNNIMDLMEDFIASEKDRESFSPVPPTTFSSTSFSSGIIKTSSTSVAAQETTPATQLKQKRERRAVVSLGSSVSIMSVDQFNKTNWPFFNRRTCLLDDDQGLPQTLIPAVQLLLFL